MKTKITKPRSLSSLKIRRFPLSETARAANPGTPTTWERGWRCAVSRGKDTQYSAHKTREEAEASADCCRGRGGRVSVFETLEEVFIMPDKAPGKSPKRVVTIGMGPGILPKRSAHEQLQKAVTFFDDELYRIQNADVTVNYIRIMFNEILGAYGCDARPQDEPVATVAENTAADLLSALRGLVDQINAAPKEWFTDACDGFALDAARVAIERASK